MMIKRYDFEDTHGEDVKPIERTFGEFITFEGHEDALLEAAVDLKELQKKYDKLVDSLFDLARNA